MYIELFDPYSGLKGGMPSSAYINIYANQPAKFASSFDGYCDVLNSSDPPSWLFLYVGAGTESYW